MKTSKMFSAIVIGIMTVLTLTLNIWGNEWYKVLTSLLAGVIVGIAIFDFELFLRAFKATKIAVSKKIANRQKFLTLSTESKKSTAKFLLSFTSMTIYFCTLTIFWHVAIGSRNPIYAFYFWMFLVLLLSCVLIHLMFKDEDKQSDRIDKSIHFFIIKVGKFVRLNMDDEKNFGFVAAICWPITLPISLIICIIGLSAIIFFLFSQVLKILIYCVIYSLQLIISIPLFIGFVFKAINQNNDSLIIAWSIAFGGLIGTISFSYLIGIIVGLVIMICSLISNKYEIKPDLFIQGEYNFAQKFAKRF